MYQKKILTQGRISQWKLYTTKRYLNYSMGQKNASNNNLKVQEKTVIETHELEKSRVNQSSVHSSSMDSKSPDIFNINFSAARNIDKTSTICVSCVRFSSTARALNPAITATSRPCSSCNGSTCQLCLNQCKGCSSAVCG